MGCAKGIAFLGIVDLVTTCVVRLVIILILLQCASPENLFNASLNRGRSRELITHPLPPGLHPDGYVDGQHGT